MKIQPVRAKSFHVGGQTKLIAAFRIFVNMPKNWIYEIHGHSVYYLHNCKLGYNTQLQKFPNLQRHDMTCLCYEKHHNMMVQTGLSFNVLFLLVWTPFPPTIFTFQNNTCTQHVFVHNCKAISFRQWSSKKFVSYPKTEISHMRDASSGNKIIRR